MRCVALRCVPPVVVTLPLLLPAAALRCAPADDTRRDGCHPQPSERARKCTLSVYCVFVLLDVPYPRRLRTFDVHT
ncbi:hypothetical protein C8R44DRAFT_804014 [Mycena epipterygia]|nr:hypothetical protein C8R44DRAFT_804014 [Mycena epipterygia]